MSSSPSLSEKPPAEQVSILDTGTPKGDLEAPAPASVQQVDGVAPEGGESPRKIHGFIVRLRHKHNICILEHIAKPPFTAVVYRCHSYPIECLPILVRQHNCCRHHAGKSLILLSTLDFAFLQSR